MIKSPLELGHVWPENYSVNSSQKVWAANFAAHHPNLAALDLSSFKCGHDAPTYSMIDTILGTAKTPAAALHDLDANKPGGSIKIRVKTYAHSLRLRQEHLEELSHKRHALGHALDQKRLELLEAKRAELGALRPADIGLEREIHELRAKVQAYVPPSLQPELPANVIRLGRKLDGRIVPVRQSATPAE